VVVCALLFFHKKKRVQGNSVRHDPPLVFDLAADPAESSPLDPKLPSTQAIVTQLETLLHAQMVSVNTTMRSEADYSTDPRDNPCCNATLPACRCHSFEAAP
jgi:hypothetical protein